MVIIIYILVFSKINYLLCVECVCKFNVCVCVVYLYFSNDYSPTRLILVWSSKHFDCTVYIYIGNKVWAIRVSIWMHWPFDSHLRGLINYTIFYVGDLITYSFFFLLIFYNNGSLIMSPHFMDDQGSNTDRTVLRLKKNS